MKTDLYNIKNEKVGTVDLPESIFAMAWKPELVKQTLIAQLANARRPWAHAKDRSEVRGGGRKPWRQKGTGRARHGSRRSPLWVGGGKAHGPTNTRDYSQKVNRKMRKGAIASLLSQKLASLHLKVLDRIEVSGAKTKTASQIMHTLLNIPSKQKRFDALVVSAPKSTTLVRAMRNLVKTKVSDPNTLNVYDLVNYRTVLIDQAAVPAIEKAYAFSRENKTTVKKSHE